MFHPYLCEAVATALKDKTVDAHQELEDLLIPKLHAVRSKVDYALLLQTFYGYFTPVEKSIEQHITCHQLPDIGQRRKAVFLIDDLACLGFSAVGLPLSHYLPMIESEVEAWGALYVLEGSTLGGRGITKMLLKQCPELSLQEIKFFNGYGDQTGAMWIRFQKALNALAYQTDDLATAVHAANTTFLKFKLWIEHSMARPKAG